LKIDNGFNAVGFPFSIFLFSLRGCKSKENEFLKERENKIAVIPPALPGFGLFL